jgi:hypothetical protein
MGGSKTTQVGVLHGSLEWVYVTAFSKYANDARSKSTKTYRVVLVLKNNNHKVVEGLSSDNTLVKRSS